MKHERLIEAVDRLSRGAVGMTTRALSEAGSAADLTLQQWRALVAVAEAGMAGIRVGELGRRLGVAPPGASRLVRRLEARGLVVVVRDAPDRRAAHVRATDAGRAMWTTVGVRRRQHIAEALGDDGLGTDSDPVALVEALAQALARHA